MLRSANVSGPASWPGWTNRPGWFRRSKRPENGQGHGDYLQLIDADSTRQLSEFAREQRVTLNTLVQSAWLLVLQRCTGQSSVTFGATVAGRPAELPGVEEQLGLFINTLPVIASPRPEQRVADWVQQVQAKNIALREHEHTPLYDIQRWHAALARRCSTPFWCSRTTRCPRHYSSPRRRGWYSAACTRRSRLITR